MNATITKEPRFYIPSQEEFCRGFNDRKLLTPFLVRGGVFCFQKGIKEKGGPL